MQLIKVLYDLSIELGFNSNQSMDKLLNYRDIEQKIAQVSYIDVLKSC